MKKKTGGMEYPVEIAKDVFAEGNETLAKTLKAVAGEDFQIVLVADANVVSHTPGLGSAIGHYLQAQGLKLAGAPIVLAGGEKIKADEFGSARQIASALLDARVGRNDIVLVIGGGTLLDVAGWAAAQVRGGLKVVRMPTTPAAMLDAAFAATAALDAPSIKDAYSVSAVPAAVVIDPAFAKTVLDGVWRGGYGEAVRLAAVADSALMKKLAEKAGDFRNRDMAVLEEAIEACLEVRGKKGGSDFALWSAQRLESMSGYKLPHGYSVPIAICIDCAYAVQKGVLKDEHQELICRALADCGALDGLAHSRHLLAQADGILRGLDARRLSTGTEAIRIPSGVGKSVLDESPDREVFRQVFAEFLKEASAPTPAAAE